MRHKLKPYFIILFFFSSYAHDYGSLINHARDLYLQGDFEASISAHQQLVSLFPNNAQALNNYGYVLRKSGHPQEAVAPLKSALKLNPCCPQTHVCLAQAYLTLGNYSDGWQELEWRLGKRPESVQELKTYLHNSGNLAGKTVLIRAEWGLGDTMQFIRYAQLLKNLKATIIVSLGKPLVNLLALCSYIDLIIGPDQSIPPFHFEVPMLSLPVVFETTEKTIPHSIPYLQAAPDLLEKWRKKLSGNNFKIGICWRGNIVHNEHKFIPLKQLVSLADIPDVTLYSLQQCHGLEQLETVDHNKLIIFDNTFDQAHGSFMDTAAVIHHLDLVITVDTSIAHLAGALGTPVWVILPHSADWRWMRERNDSPWYPTMQLFRQPVLGDWKSVITNIKNKVKRLCKKK